MAKELPYFKYFPSEWVTGDITLCSLEAQGLFINICSFYWMKNCSMSLANAKQRFSKHLASLKELLDFGIIKVNESDNIVINFLDEQMNEFINISEKRAKAGHSGGKAKAKQLLKFAKAKASNIDKEEDIDKDNIIEEIYKEYPSKCPIKGSSTGKTKKNKDKIRQLLKDHSPDELKKIITWYISDCKKSNTFIKNLGTFLNNLPDIEEVETKIKENKEKPLKKL